MIIVNEKEENKEYEIRKSSYVVIKNDLGKLAITEKNNKILLLLGGGMDDNETSTQTVEREVLEEIGYEVKDLKYIDTFVAFYDVKVKGKIIACNNIADIYVGNLGNKIQEPIEKDHKLKWLDREEVIGNMYLDFQNDVLKYVLKENK